MEHKINREIYNWSKRWEERFPENKTRKLPERWAISAPF